MTSDIFEHVVHLQRFQGLFSQSKRERERKRERVSVCVYMGEKESGETRI